MPPRALALAVLCLAAGPALAGSSREPRPIARDAFLREAGFPEGVSDKESLAVYARELVGRGSELLARTDPTPAAELRALVRESAALEALRGTFPEEIPREVAELHRRSQEAFTGVIRRRSGRLERRLASFIAPWKEHPDDPLVFEDWLEGMRGRPSITAGSPFLAMGKLEGLSRRTELPEAVAVEVARDLVEHHASRNYADLILSNQRRLPPGALEVLRAALRAPHSDTRLKAASYVRLHDPRDELASRVIREHIETTPEPRGWEGLLHRTLLAGHDFFFETTPQQVLKVARRKFEEKKQALHVQDPSGALHAVFESFLARATRYTRNARRLAKTLREAIHGRWPSGERKRLAYWDGLLPRPEEAREDDMAFKRAVVAALQDALPRAIAAENARIREAREPGVDLIAGALIVGSLAAGHPTRDSDLDLILVTENGGPVPPDSMKRLAAYLRNKNLPLRAAEGIIDAEGWGFNRRADSLGVQRLIALGAIFIPAEGREGG